MPRRVRGYSRLSRVGVMFASILVAFPRTMESQQSQGNVILEPNEQLFSVLAALNVSGYDTGLGAENIENTRHEVRDLLAKRNIPVVAQLRKFYAEHSIQNDPGADLGQYVSLALMLGSPPNFAYTVAEDDLPPDAKTVKGLVPLLRTFDQQADLTQLWIRAQARHEMALEAYTEPVRHSIALTDAYLRLFGGAYLGRTYNIYISLLGAPEQVQARIYGQNYYLVVTPSKAPRLQEIRHQYLHFVLDPLAAKYSQETRQKTALAGIARLAPALGTDFKEDFPLLVTECLIRAIELRIDKPTTTQKTLADLTASGLILTPYFYEALGEFQKGQTSINASYRDMIVGIDLAAEKRRLASVKFSAVAPAGELAAGPTRPAQALSEQDRLLNQGDNLVFEGKYAEARTAFQTALEKFDPKNERALYGMAVCAANMRKPDLAEEYFQKTLDAARTLRIAAWSHIYLGRIYDINSKRDAALAQYRAAAVVAGAFPDAAAAAARGLQQAYGTKAEVRQ